MVTWDHDLLDILLKASGVSSKQVLQKIILRLARDLDINLKSLSDRPLSR